MRVDYPSLVHSSGSPVHSRYAKSTGTFQGARTLKAFTLLQGLAT